MRRRRKRLRRQVAGRERVAARKNSAKKAAAVLAITVAAAAIMLTRDGKGKETEVQKMTVEQQANQEEERRQEEERMRQKYGCCLYDTYEYPFNTMSQDWSGDQVEGFFYHDISEECRAAGGQFPVIMQVYTYILCDQYDVDYEMVFALIEKESKCVWDASGDGGASVGFMQITEKWNQERMERLNCTDLMQPFQNVKVGIDILAELQEQLKGTVPDDQLPYDVLAAYNHGLSGAQQHLWSKGVHEYSYNREIMERAQQLKQETKRAREGRETGR